MMRRLSGKLVIASHNRGKLAEIADLLAPYGIEAVSALDLNLPEPEEIGATFVDNAQLKARAPKRTASVLLEPKLIVRESSRR